MHFKLELAVAKKPVSYGMERALLNVFPAAKLATTHRNLKKTIPSFCSTSNSYCAPFSDAPINHAVGIGQLIWGLNLHMVPRTEVKGMVIHDIDYRSLVQSAASVIEKLYAFCGWPLKPSSRNAMLKWDGKDSRERKARHKYMLADSGLTEHAVKEQFANYNGLLRQTFWRVGI